MYGTWNCLIRTPVKQFYTVFRIYQDENKEIKLLMRTDPPGLNLTFAEISVEGNTLRAAGVGAGGRRHPLELTFNEDTFAGMMEFPYLGKMSFEGNRGEGVSLAEKLRKYGEKSVADNRYWRGQWIWDVQQPEDDGIRLVLFRRTFYVPDGVNPGLTVEITADSRYRLYVNGTSVAVGPCKGDNHVHYYETVDVSQHLVKGENVLAVQVLKYPYMEPFSMGEGGPISVWRTMSGGLFVEASLRDTENGTELEELHSGPKWRAYRHQGYRHVPSSLIQWMGGTEEVNGQHTPQDWILPGFDDSAWKQAVLVIKPRNGMDIGSPWNLTPRPIPGLYEEPRQFLEITNSTGVSQEEANRLLDGKTNGGLSLQTAPGEKIAIELDAGELTTGYLTIGMQGGRGSIVRLLCAEGYDAPDSVEQRRKKGNREDRNGKLIGDYDVYHVAGRSQEIYEPFGFRTFRYVRLEIETGAEPLTVNDLTYRETGYPLEVQASFQCSDEQLNQIWDLSIRTLKRCMHETYEDCPYYEQLQYAMDSRLMMLFTYYVSADDRLARRTIDDFYRSRLPSGMLQSRYPSFQAQVIPSFSLYWIDMLAEHYDFYGDRELIVKYRPAMIELLDWFHERLTDEGIVGVTSNRYWTYFDWVDAWLLGAPPESVDRPMFLLSLMYAAALRKAARLLGVTGWHDAEREMIERADHVCRAVYKLAWSDERKLFRELPETEIYTQHSQIMAVLSGTITGEEARMLLERAMEEPIHRVTLPFSYLLMQALKQTGHHDRLFQLWDRWRVFAEQGLTTLPETELNPRSDCEILLAHDTNGMFFYLERGLLLGVITVESAEYELDQIKQSCEAYIHSCQRYFYCDLSCYIGYPVEVHQIAFIITELRNLNHNNVAYHNQVFVMNEGDREEWIIALPELSVWISLLKTGSKDSFIVNVERFLDQLVQKQTINATVLNQLHQDLMQVLYSYLNNEGIQAHKLFGDEHSMKLSEQASRSVRDLMEWVHHTLNKALKQAETVKESNSVVQIVQRYIAQHIDQDLSRESIAEMVYLNPDHLSRLFKKETGLSLSEYILTERIRIAKELLSQTDIPVSSIASSVGHTNFSHFARIFKKHVGAGPSEYRHQLSRTD